MAGTVKVWHEVTGTTMGVFLVEQIEVELSVLVVVMYVGGQLVSTGVMCEVLVQLVTSGIVEAVTVHVFVLWHCRVVVFVDVDQMVTSIVRGGG